MGCPMETEPGAVARTCTGAGQGLSKAPALNQFLGAILSGQRWLQVYRILCFWRDESGIFIPWIHLTAAATHRSLQDST